jgi:hypothetical protein
MKRTAGQGISWEEYVRLLNAQNGVCAICKRQEQQSGKKLAVDHDHATGAIRGLLCADCNIKLPLVERFASRRSPSMGTHDNRMVPGLWSDSVGTIGMIVVDGGGHG